MPVYVDVAPSIVFQKSFQLKNRFQGKMAIERYLVKRDMPFDRARFHIRIVARRGDRDEMPSFPQSLGKVRHMMGCAPL